jgi:hypothetical protein
MILFTDVGLGKFAKSSRKSIIYARTVHIFGSGSWAWTINRLFFALIRSPSVEWDSKIDQTSRIEGGFKP